MSEILVPEILQKSVGEPIVDFLRDGEFASFREAKDPQEQRRIAEFVITQSDIGGLYNHRFTIQTQSFSPDGLQLKFLSVQSGSIYHENARFDVELLDCGTVINPRTKSSNIMLFFVNIGNFELTAAQPVDVVEDAENQLFIGAVKSGEVGIPVLALNLCSPAHSGKENGF